MPRLALLLVLGLAACTPQNGATRLSASSTASIGLAATLIGAERAQAGTAPITQNSALQAAAQAHADDLAARSGLSHTGSDGSEVSDRIARASYTACFAAENIARGQPDVETVIADWTGSAGHYANMVNPCARHFGFARSADVWVLVLARPC